MPRTSPAPAVSRRAFLRAAGATTAATATAVAVQAAAPAAQAAVPLVPASRQRTRWTAKRQASPLPQVPSTDLARKSSDAFLFHLLRRATYAGPIPEAISAARAAGGATGWLETQLAPSASADAALDSYLDRHFPLAHAAAPAIYAAVENGSWVPMDDLVNWTIGKRTWSRNQLFEMTVEFFSDHLNIATPSTDVWATKPSYDRDVIRRHAFGKFSDMLVASTLHPAMLLYLTNTESSKSAPNENLGRELLELHTVGRDAGYGQAGVVACSRALTGLTLWHQWNGGTPATFGTPRYRDDWHHTGPLSLLGWSHPNADPSAGRAVVESLCRYLAGHPSTARRLAHKLCVRFVSDTPPAALVDRLARTYLSGGTAIVPVLRQLFTSAEFAESAGQKYRRPFEDAAASLRALGVAPDTTAATTTNALRDWRWAFADSGHAPLGWNPPDGYPDVAGAWIGTGAILGRWNFHVSLVGQWHKEAVQYPDLAARLLPGGPPSTRRALVQALTSRLMPGQAVTLAEQDAVVAFLGGDGPLTSDDMVHQLRLVVALVLDSPTWSAR